MVDDSKVVELYESGLTQSQVGDRVGITQSRVSQILSEYEVDTGFSKWWTEEEVEFLRSYYPPKSDSMKQKLIDELCVDGRSWKSVREKAARLGITRSLDEYRGSEANKRVLERVTTRIEIDLAEPNVGYVVGVLDSDGYTNNTTQLGLEVRDRVFLEKFADKLSGLGFNPTTKRSHRSDSKYVLYASSRQFVQWYNSDPDRFGFTPEQQRLYLEGLFEGDGTIHKTGYCMICSTNPEFKEFLSEFLEQEFDFTTKIWQVGIALVPLEQRMRFFEIINPVIKGPDYYDDNRTDTM